MYLEEIDMLDLPGRDRSSLSGVAPGPPPPPRWCVCGSARSGSGFAGSAPTRSAGRTDTSSPPRCPAGSCVWNTTRTFHLEKLFFVSRGFVGEDPLCLSWSYRWRTTHHSTIALIFCKKIYIFTTILSFWRDHITWCLCHIIPKNMQRNLNLRCSGESRISPNFPQNFVKLKEFGDGGRPKFYYVDPSTDLSGTLNDLTCYILDCLHMLHHFEIVEG